MALSEITNYIEDDWDDNNLTGRTGSEEGYYLHPSDNLISDVEAGSTLKGVYRPDWTVGQGSLSASSGDIVLSPGDVLKTPSKLTVGSWSYDYTLLNVSSTLYHRFSFMGTGSVDSNQLIVNGYSIYIDNQSTGGFQLIRLDSTGDFNTIIDHSPSKDTNTHSAEVTRDSFGGFEFYRDGVSVGTASDTTYSEARIIAFGNDSNGSENYRADNLVVQ